MQRPPKVGPSSFFKEHRALLFLTTGQRETFLCLSRILLSQPALLMSKRELRREALRDPIFLLPKSPQTYSDHLRKLICIGVLEEDQSDNQVVRLTPLGVDFRAALIEWMRRRT